MPQQLPDLLLQWLYRVLQPEYANPVLNYQDASLILMVYNFLKVRTSVHVNDLGKDELLLNFHGDYLISGELKAPLGIWLPFDYPKSPPLIYLQNTINGYTLTPNNYFDSNGRFYHPLLSSWFQSYGNDTNNNNVQPKDNRLLKLLETFLHCAKHYSPYIKLDSSSPAQPAHLVPALPPKPIINHPIAVLSNQTSPSPSVTPEPRLPFKPSLPSDTTSIPDSVSTITSPSAGGPQYRVQQPRLAVATIKLVTEQMESLTSSTASSRPPLLPPNPNRQQHQLNIDHALQAAKATTIQEFNNSVIIPVLALQNKLVKLNESYINDTNYMSYLSAKVEQNENLILLKTNEIQQTLSQLDSLIYEKLPEVDNGLIAETAVYNQLYDLVCKYESIADLLVVLEDLMGRGKLVNSDNDNGVDNYLKKVRELSREQCLIKLHIDKLVDLCGLDNKVDY